MQESARKLEFVNPIGDLFVSNKLIGDGCYSKVYLGYVEKQENVVAIKFIKKNDLNALDRKNLDREIENMKAIDHKNIVKFKKFYETKSSCYISMEFCKNGTMSDYLADRKRTPELITRFGKDIIEGFRFLYSKNIVHRDIKPDNILIGDDGTAKLSDFGFSRTLDEKDKANFGLTHIGSPMYASPQVLSQGPYSSKCDVFSVGILLYEAFFQHHPFFPDGYPTTFKELNSKVCFGPEHQIIFPEEPILSENFKNLIKGMTRREEGERLSWPEVFELFEPENFPNKELDKLLYYDFSAKAIQEVLNDCPENLKLPLFRIRFTLFMIISVEARKLGKALANNAGKNEFPEFNLKLQKLTEQAEAFYIEEFNNQCLLELNNLLKLDEKNPDKNNIEPCILMLKSKIKAVLEIWKEKFLDEQERKKMLLCLWMLQDYPQIPDVAKQIVEENKDKPEAHIRAMIYK